MFDFTVSLATVGVVAAAGTGGAAAAALALGSYLYRPGSGRRRAVTIPAKKD